MHRRAKETVRSKYLEQVRDGQQLRVSRIDRVLTEPSPIQVIDYVCAVLNDRPFRCFDHGYDPATDLRDDLAGELLAAGLHFSKGHSMHAHVGPRPCCVE